LKGGIYNQIWSTDSPITPKEKYGAEGDRTPDLLVAKIIDTPNKKYSLVVIARDVTMRQANSIKKVTASKKAGNISSLLS
jgi:hypothetical protein